MKNSSPAAKSINDSEMSAENNPELARLLSAGAVRETGERVFQFTQAGEGHFLVHMDKMDALAAQVVEVIKDRHPTLEIPFHSRWSHFQVGQQMGWNILTSAFNDMEELEVARTKIDLAVVSVLLDAGAGPKWSFKEEGGESFARSEGLAIASLRMFLGGFFSSDPQRPLQVDAAGLLHTTMDGWKSGFQISVGNPLLGLEGRAQLIFDLGQCLLSKSEYFGDASMARPGHLVDYWLEKYPNKKIQAQDILKTILYALGPTWPGRLKIEGHPLGDVWWHEGLSKKQQSGHLVFHKLSQWLCYSLVEPLMDFGFEVVGLDGLTGLAEYRNGGLFLDSGVLELKQAEMKDRPHPVDSELILEWRALTVALLDRLAPLIRKQVGERGKNWPLMKILEGGTWWAGRKLAFALRTSGDPPLQIESDGTVF